MIKMKIIIKNIRLKNSPLIKLKSIIILICVLSAQISIAADYYWVGGTGNWSDINHWATSSGGGVFHAQVPTSNDNVYFDINSFTESNNVITINLGNAVCRDMDWTSAALNPIMEGQDTINLRIYGSLKLITNMTQNFHGTISFESTSPGKSISLSGKSIYNHIYFQGNGGGWSLTDDFVTTNNVYFIHGTLNTNNHYLTCYGFYSTVQNPRTLNLGNSTIEITNWDIDGTNLELDASSSLIKPAASLTNSNGNILEYNNVYFTGLSSQITNNNVYTIYNNINFPGLSGQIINNNEYAIYNNINFNKDGGISGNCKIDTVLINGNGTINDSDSINFVQINGKGHINGGNHVIKRVIFYDDGRIEGDNKVDTAIFMGSGIISGNNIIDSTYIRISGLINSNNTIRQLYIVGFAQIAGTNTIHEATLKADANFGGQNTFDILTFSPGHTYTFGINSTQTIVDEFNITADCYAPIRMLSDTNGVQATILKINGGVIGDYLSLRDIKAAGNNTPFIANNSVDLGNNTNWQIETTGGIDLYWVNGSGNWDDPNHWDVISGGAGGHCPPTEIDNVYFNQNSFNNSGQFVNINVGNAVCKNMDWNGAGFNPALTGPVTNNLRIYGLLNFISSMDLTFNGQIFFEATENGQTIYTAEKVFNNNAWFNGRGGTWDLLDNFSCSVNIFFQQGKIFSLANDINCYKFVSDDTTTRTLNLSTSTISLYGMVDNVWLLNGINLTLYADSSLIKSNGGMGNIVSFNGNKFIYNNVEFNGNGSSLINQGAYCVYNLVSFFKDYGQITGDCTIDTACFYGTNGTIMNSDTIKTAIFHSKNGMLDGANHVVEISFFYDDGYILGNNQIDTALFYRNGNIQDTNFIDTTIIYNQALISGYNNIRTATLLGDGKFYGENTFDVLTLTKVNSYYFEHDKTQTIIDEFNAIGACTGPIILQSDLNTQQAILHKVNGTIEADYLSLRDIKGSGNGIPFTAYNSVDLGNNENWIIHTTEPLELYWVGGKGNWNDSLHWAGTSGGIEGYCIPTPIDNVYFDENSFYYQNDTIFINIGNAVCNNMDWTGAEFNPVFYGPDTNSLRIFGSLKFINEMNLQFKGYTFFESVNKNNFITSANQSFNNDVYFQGINGEWILNDNFSVDENLNFIFGTLNSNQKNIYCRVFNSDYPNQRSLIIESSIITVNGGSAEAWFIDGTNLNFSAENSLIISTGTDGFIRTDNGGQLNYYNIEFQSDRSRLYNNNVNANYNFVKFENDGHIHGDCIIDTVLFFGNGSIYNSDIINYVEIYGSNGNLSGGSHEIKTIIFNGNGNITGNNSIDSTIIYENGNITGNNTINKILNIYGNANIDGNNFINNAQLFSNGILKDNNTFNELKFYPGNTYELEEGVTQTINMNFYIRGNNCFPITLRSLNEGEQAVISVPTGIISGDFIDMRDIQATGGASFFAGNYSTDISNNSGWTFTNSPGYIYGFTSDTTICSGDEVIINTDNFNTDINTTFLWQDGSTAPTYTVTNEDSLWVKVMYAYNCSYTDTILIYRLPKPYVDLGEDITVCEGDTIFVKVESDSLDFYWNNGSTDSIYFAFQTGLCWVTVTDNNGCSSTDSIYLTVLPLPVVNLGNDTTLRYNEYITLNAGNPGATYYWSTGNTTQTITVSGEQLIWVEVEKDGCINYDTILISEFPQCILAVPTGFSPNGDGQNDILYIRGSGFSEFELMIFNRIGELVFQTKDISIGWDGTFKGKKQEMDVYNYYLKGRCISGQQIIKKGNITLLR